MNATHLALVAAADALEELLREVARRDGEGNVLPNHLPAMRQARVALALCRSAASTLDNVRRPE